MFDLNTYRDSIHGLLLPSAATFAALNTNDYRVRELRNAGLLQEGTDLVKFTVNNTPRIFYTLIGLRKLCEMLPSGEAQHLQQVLNQMFPPVLMPQLPAIASPPPPSITLPLGRAPLPQPTAPAVVQPGYDWLDPLAPAPQAVETPPSPPQWAPLTQHPAVGAILQGRGYANADEVTARIEMVLAQQALQQPGWGVDMNPFVTDARTILEAQRLMVEATLRSQNQTTEAMDRGAQIAREVAEDRKPQDTLNSSLLSAAFVCGLFVAAFVLVSAWNSVQEGLSRPYKQPLPQPVVPQPLQAPTSYTNPQ